MSSWWPLFSSPSRGSGGIGGAAGAAADVEDVVLKIREDKKEFKLGLAKNIDSSMHCNLFVLDSI